MKKRLCKSSIVGKDKLYWELIPDLKEAFQESDLPFRVDVLDWLSIDEGFRDVISKSGYEVIFSKKA